MIRPSHPGVFLFAAVMAIGALFNRRADLAAAFVFIAVLYLD